jgi:O-methyltransferase
MKNMLGEIKRKIRDLFCPDPIESLIKKVSPYTMVEPEKIKNLIRLCEYLNQKGVEGDFVECGVCKGGTAAILSKYMGTGRHLWLYDSFEGLPEATSRDGEEAKKLTCKCLASPADVKEVMGIVSTKEDRYTIKKGWFSETFKEKLPSKVALLHCDADWYESVILTLEIFYGLIPRGGCVILDDYGCWEGSREAFYDFCAKHNEKPLLERVGYSQAYWIKGRLSNR